MERTRTFSINLPFPLYEKLVNKAGKGRVSTFIKKLVEKELSDEDKKLGQAYKECYANNSHLLEEAKLWEKAGIEAWLNWKDWKTRPWPNGRGGKENPYSFRFEKLKTFPPSQKNSKFSIYDSVVKVYVRAWVDFLPFGDNRRKNLIKLFKNIYIWIKSKVRE